MPTDKIPDNIGDSEPDMDPSPGHQDAPTPDSDGQDYNAGTGEVLRKLGAGQPYRSAE